MDISATLFYSLSALILIFAFLVIWLPNPIYSALSLVLTMVSLAFTYLLLKAPFIAGVQLAVYAGAVTVLFLMVIMIFDLKKEKEAFSKGYVSGMVKIVIGGGLLGLLAGAINLSSDLFLTGQVDEQMNQLTSMASTKALALTLFSKYLFAFEALGLLLLLIAVGVVAISRAKGGTHAKS
ncbi:MAG: NADH-quinone oxidoreductase subunit J [Bdellovibrionales bacterium]|nr:NADH-quinone oxidoreductase subunit J [Bdellovibrionales bacterium]